VITSSRFIAPLLLAVSACGGPPREVARTPPPPRAAVPPDAAHVPDPDLDPPPRKPLLAIDWKAVRISTDADALALWQQIAPTGADAEQKLEEVPGDFTEALAIALLHQGNFTCVPPAPPPCSRAPLDVPDPADDATLADPCLRRVLALWSLAQLDPEDVPKIRDALRAIVAIPPPESQLVAAALRALPESDVDGRYELLGIAWKAGQHELVNGALSGFDETKLADATLKLHIDGALEILSAEVQRGVYLKAIADEQLASATRTQAIAELAATADTLAPDLHAALIALTRSPDCVVAAAAARTLETHGDARFVPRRPRSARPAAILRGLCVLASYETLQRADEVSLVPTYLPPRGLELVTIVYDPYNEVDTDGDGDPHTERTIELISRDLAVLPEADDLIVAMHHCTGTTCRSDDHEFRFVFRSGLLWRLEVVDRPPCKP
jgi:hypothetical protein